jgi:hypothetical protein
MKPAQVLPFAANWLWTQNSYADYHRFILSLENPGSAQERYLKDLLHQNADTQYGRINNFSQILSVGDFEKKVPLTQYEDYLPYVEEISRGKSSILTHDPVFLFQPTSGSSSASKLIPYTKSLQAEYKRAIAAWICHLYRRVPDIKKGRAYWSISPAIEREKFFGCIPVGFKSDSEYLGIIGKRLFYLVSVGQSKFTPDISIDDFWGGTLINLLAARNLTLVSVWSPTFLLILIKHFVENWTVILGLLSKSHIQGARTRAEEIQKIIQKQGLNFEAIWPDLKLISCWTHGASETYIGEIRACFPNIEIQSKGLVATEAFVSLPLQPDKDPVLAVNSHFFEFLDIETGRLYLAHELHRDSVYSVIVTTGGGLYRYQLNDLLKVTGFIAATPTLRFISRNTVSDLFGEKLNIEHVQRSITLAFAECSINPTFSLLAPVRLSDQKTTAYTLFFHSHKVTGAQGRTLREKLEDLFLENHHYAYCRRLGQLGSLKVFLIDYSVAPPESVYLQEMSRRGQKLGDIKPSILDRETGWEQRFQGRFLDIDNS